MVSIRFALLFTLLLSNVWAQPAAHPQTTASQGLTEQGRAELRQALKAQGARELVTRPQIAAAASPHRHLSEQERAALRQQLRAQRPAAQPERP
jgi:thermostable 8-oxoguanine DNA glycosylase